MILLKNRVYLIARVLNPFPHFDLACKVATPCASLPFPKYTVLPVSHLLLPLVRMNCQTNEKDRYH